MSVLVNFAYGANLSPSCLTARRGIHPISWRRAKLAGWTFDFTLRGLPILEPAFGNVTPCMHTLRKLVHQQQQRKKQSANAQPIHSAEVAHGVVDSNGRSSPSGTIDLSLNEFLAALTAYSSLSDSTACECYVEGVCYELSATDFDRLMRFEGTSISAHKRSDWGYIPLQLTFNVEETKHAALDGASAALQHRSQQIDEAGDWHTQPLDSINGYVLTAPAQWSNFYETDAKLQGGHWKNRRCDCMNSRPWNSALGGAAASVNSAVHSALDESSGVPVAGAEFSPVSVHLLRQRCSRMLPSQRYVSLLQDGATQLHLSQRYRHDIAQVRELARKRSFLSVLAVLALLPLAIAYFILMSPFLLCRVGQRRFITMAPFKLRTAAATQFLFGVPLFRLLFDCAWTLEERIHRMRNRIFKQTAAQQQQEHEQPPRKMAAASGHSRARAAFAATVVRSAHSPGLDTASTAVALTGDDAVAS